MYTIGGIVYSTELYHHGILGMRWGDKNGPPYPLGSGDHSASEKKAGYKKSLGGGRNEELYDRKEKKVSKNNYRMVKMYEKRADKLEKQGQKRKANNARKAAEKMKQLSGENYKEPRKKTTYKQKLINRYKGYGLTAKQAEEAANRKIEIEKGVAIGAVTVAALAGAWYFRREIGRNITGKIIKKGTIMQTLSENDDRIKKMVDSGEHFYTTFTKKDKLTYLSDFGGLSKFINQAKATQDIKIASRNQGIEILKDTFKKTSQSQRQEIADALTNGHGFWRVNASDESRANIRKAIFSNDLDILSKKDLGLLYDGINYKLGDQEHALLSFRPQLYAEFVNKGYGGLIDTNDTRYSQLVGDFPSIIIDKTKFDVLPTTKINDAQIAQIAGWDVVRGLSQAARQGKMYTALVTASGAASVLESYDTKQRRKAYLNMTEEEVKNKINKDANEITKIYGETKESLREKQKYIDNEMKWYKKHKDKT